MNIHTATAATPHHAVRTESPTCSDLHGPELTRRHRLLVVAGRDPPGLPGRLDAATATLALAGGVERDAAAGDVRLDVQGPISGRRRALQDIRRRGRRLRPRRGRRASVVLKPLEAARARRRPHLRGHPRPPASTRTAARRASPCPAPGPRQTLARARAARRPGSLPREIGYVEAHGTGTAGRRSRSRLTALGAVFGDGRGPRRAAAVGSVKTNIGHTEAAAGVAGVIKAALAITTARSPPQGWLDKPEPRDRRSTALGLRVPPRPQRWAADAARDRWRSTDSATAARTRTRSCRIPPDPAPRHDLRGRSSRILPISARSDAAAARAGRALAALAAPAPDPDDAGSPRRRGTGARTTRSAPALLVGRRRDDLRRELRRRSRAGERPRRRRRTIAERDPSRFSCSPVWARSGGGWGANCSTAGGYVRARTRARSTTSSANWRAGRSSRRLLREEDDSRSPEPRSPSPRTSWSRSRLEAELEALGITPAAIVGHSVGEVTAAYVSGMLSLPDAVRGRPTTARGCRRPRPEAAACSRSACPRRGPRTGSATTRGVRYRRHQQPRP